MVSLTIVVGSVYVDATAHLKEILPEVAHGFLCPCAKGCEFISGI